MTLHPVINALRNSFESAPPGVPLLVAFSGGMDSHVLLHAVCELCAATGSRGLRAVHVNHGLHPSASAWEAHCQSICSGLGVPLEVIRVVVCDADSRGMEAAARQSRYRAFADILGEDEILCLAHHLDDQAETFLLQLLRGAGPKGLSAMPAYAAFAAGGLLRPFLNVPRSAIRSYAERCALQWVEDPGNMDMRFDRNYLRHEILPLLRARWPGAMRTIARAAGHQAAVSRAAAALGDAASAGAAGEVADTLDCASLAALDRGVAALAVRAWLARQGFAPPPAERMARIFDEVIGAREDASPRVDWSGVEVRRYRGRLYAMARLARPERGTSRPWNFRVPLEFSHGRLEATRVMGSGLDAERCAQGMVEVRFRRGGERCRPSGEKRSSPLKHWFHRRGVPPWERDRIPLIYVDAELAAVAGGWVCAGFEPAPDTPGWLLQWRPHASSTSVAGV